MKTLNIGLLESNIEKSADYDLAENNLFGCSYCVKQNGKTVYKKHFGVTNPHTKSPVSDGTIFRLASMTKPITAVAMLILIEQGLISLLDPVKKYFPEFSDIHIITENGDDLGKTPTDVTVLHLLSHTSGFGGLKNADMTAQDKKSIKNTVNYFFNAGLDFEPFTKQAYSPVASFDLLAEITEKVTGEDFEDFLKKQIFEPCGMPDTVFVPSDGQWKRIITLHRKADGKNSAVESPKGCIFRDYPCTHKLGGAGLVSTLDDYSRFAEMLLNRGKTRSSQIVSEKSFNLLTVPYVPAEIMPGNQRFGLGMRIITDETYNVLPVGAYGWSGAYGTHFWVDPQNGITAVFMKNSEFDGGAGNASACRFENAVHSALLD